MLASYWRQRKNPYNGVWVRWWETQGLIGFIGVVVAPWASWWLVPVGLLAVVLTIYKLPKLLRQAREAG